MHDADSATAVRRSPHPEADAVVHVSAGGALVQVASGDPGGGDAVVVELFPATVTLTRRRVLATTPTGEWCWWLSDLDHVVHAGDGDWSILAVPGVPDHGVAVPPGDVTAFRAALDGLRGVEPVHDLRSAAPGRSPEAPTPLLPPSEGPSSAPPRSPSDVPPSVALRSRSEAPPRAVPQAPVNDTVVDHQMAAGASTGGLARLEALGVSAWFGTHHVLDRVSLVMEPGEVTALIGPSGCGKSTFLRILNRMHEMIPSAALAGEVRLDGDDVYDPGRRLTDARRQIGMVFQKPNPFPAMSIYDNVVASFRLTGTKVSKEDKDDVVESCLSKAGLWNEVRDRLQQPGGGLSGGQQQRLCIARALAIRPRVLLMDEPCSALDPTSTRRIEQTIQELADEVTIVIVTHNMQQAARVSHQCAFFLAEHGTPGVIVEHGPTEAMFGTPQDPRTSDYVNGRFG